MIEKLLTAYRTAVHEKDVDALVSLYDDDVRIFDMWGTWSYDGADAWRRTVREWFASLGRERVRVDFDDVQTVVADELAVVHAFVTFTGLSADGVELRAMSNRLTWALAQKGSDSWRIVHEHTSAPAELETGKVLVARRGVSASSAVPLDARAADDRVGPVG